VACACAQASYCAGHNSEHAASHAAGWLAPAQSHVGDARSQQRRKGPCRTYDRSCVIHLRAQRWLLPARRRPREQTATQSLWYVARVSACWHTLSKPDSLRATLLRLLALGVAIVSLCSVHAAQALELHRVAHFPANCAVGGTEGIEPGVGLLGAPYDVPANDGSTWFLCPAGFVRLSSSDSVVGPVPTPSDPLVSRKDRALGHSANEMTDVAAGPAGSVWFTNEYGLVCYITSSGHRHCAETPARVAAKGARVTSSGDLIEDDSGNMLLFQSSGAEADTLRTGPSLVFTQATPVGYRRLVRSASGDLWFGMNTEVGYIDPQGRVTSMPLTPEAADIAIPIVAMANGSVYFIAGSNEEKILRIAPDGDQSIVVKGHDPLAVVATPDETLWAFSQSEKAGTGFHYYRPGVYYRISSTGVATQFPLSGRFQLENLQAGPNNEVWGKTSGFTEPFGHVVSISASGAIVVHASYRLRQTLFHVVATPSALWIALSRNGTAHPRGSLYRVDRLG